MTKLERINGGALHTDPISVSRSMAEHMGGLGAPVRYVLDGVLYGGGRVSNVWPAVGGVGRPAAYWKLGRCEHALPCPTRACSKLLVHVPWGGQVGPARHGTVTVGIGCDKTVSGVEVGPGDT